MHILVLSHEYPPVGGGGGQAAKNLCRELSSRGHKIALITSRVKGQKAGWASEDGIRILKVFSFREKKYRASFISLLFYTVISVFSSLSYVYSHRPDIIHAQFAVPAGAIAWLVSKLSGTPYIVTAHLGDIPGGTPEKTGNWFRWIYPLTPAIWKEASQVISVSEFSRTLALKHYDVDIMVIYNGMEIGKVPDRDIVEGGCIRLVFAGRFVPQKAPLLIVEILEEIRDLDWEFIFIGDGPLLEDVVYEANKHNFSQSIQFTGWISVDKVVNHLYSSDVLIMPSKSEGLPVVGVQALTAGLAFVVSDIGGFRDLVANGENGYLIRDQTQYGSKLRDLITNRILLQQFKQNSVERSRRFDIVFVSDQYEELMMEIIGPSQDS